MRRGTMRAERRFVVVNFVEKALRAVGIEADIELMTAGFGLLAGGGVLQHGSPEAFRMFRMKIKSNCDDIHGELLNKF
jgi:hypothetical protein